MQKLKGFDLLKSLGSPKYILAPMVDQSELAFRMLCRSYDVDLCYTPMFHSKMWVSDENYRRSQFSTCAGDAPLVVQFCGNDAATLVSAGRLLLTRVAAENLRDNVSAIDLNLGCPQGIAKRGRYGSFLMEEPKLICGILRELDRELPVPISCKVRIFPQVQDTLHYVEQLLDTGIAMIGVHGRTREQKGIHTGLADWEQIRMVRELCDTRGVPVIANGNILSREDADACINYTGAAAVMSAESILANPALFSQKKVDCLTLTRQYLEIVHQYHHQYQQYHQQYQQQQQQQQFQQQHSATLSPPSPPPHKSIMRSHLFKMLYPVLHRHNDLREMCGSQAHTIEQFQAVLQACEKRALSDGFISHKPYNINRHPTSPQVAITPVQQQQQYLSHDTPVQQQQHLLHDTPVQQQQLQQSMLHDAPVQLQQLQQSSASLLGMSCMFNDIQE